MSKAVEKRENELLVDKSNILFSSYLYRAEGKSKKAVRAYSWFQAGGLLLSTKSEEDLVVNSVINFKEYVYLKDHDDELLLFSLYNTSKKDVKVTFRADFPEIFEKWILVLDDYYYNESHEVPTKADGEDEENLGGVIPEGVAVRQGSLVIKFPGDEAPTEYWCALNGMNLSYYEGILESDPLGLLNLHKYYLLVEETDNRAPSPDLETDMESFILQRVMSNEKVLIQSSEADAWMECLEEVGVTVKRKLKVDVQRKKQVVEREAEDVKEGFLYMLENNTFVEYFFVLTTKELLKYKTQNDTIPVDTVDMAYSNARFPEECIEDGMYFFRLFTPSREYSLTLYTSDSMELEHWKVSLSQVCRSIVKSTSLDVIQEKASSESHSPKNGVLSSLILSEIDDDGFEDPLLFGEQEEEPKKEDVIKETKDRPKRKSKRMREQGSIQDILKRQRELKEIHRQEKVLSESENTTEAQDVVKQDTDAEQGEDEVHKTPTKASTEEEAETKEKKEEIPTEETQSKNEVEQNVTPDNQDEEKDQAAKDEEIEKEKAQSKAFRKVQFESSSGDNSILSFIDFDRLSSTSGVVARLAHNKFKEKPIIESNREVKDVVDLWKEMKSSLTTMQDEKSESLHPFDAKSRRQTIAVDHSSQQDLRKYIEAEKTKRKLQLNVEIGNPELQDIGVEDVLNDTVSSEVINPLNLSVNGSLEDRVVRDFFTYMKTRALLEELKNYWPHGIIETKPPDMDKHIYGLFKRYPKIIAKQEAGLSVFLKDVEKINKRTYEGHPVDALQTPPFRNRGEFISDHFLLSKSTGIPSKPLNERYVVLKNGILYVFLSNKHMEVIDEIHLEEFKLSENDESENSIIIEKKMKSYHFQHENVRILKFWRSAFEEFTTIDDIPQDLKMKRRKDRIYLTDRWETARMGMQDMSKAMKEKASLWKLIVEEFKRIHSLLKEEVEMNS